MSGTNAYQGIEERLVALTRDLILMPGTASRPDDRERCFSFIKNHLETLERVTVREYRCAGCPSLVALPKGIDVPELLLCAHLDVIDHPDLSAYTSRIEDGRIIGPGAGDMKGALAILAELFHNFHRKHDNVSLGLAITSDEETGGDHGIRFLFDEVGLRCGLAINPDGGALNEITVEEKGALHVHLKAQGHAIHAARPWLGHNPLEHLISRITELKQYFDTLKSGEDHWAPTCTLTILHTPNRSSNRVPSQADAVLDIRFPSPHSVEEMLREVRKILGPDIEVEARLSAEPLKVEPDPLFVRTSEEICGNPALMARDAGASDSRFIIEHGIPVIMCRPTVGELHAEEEWIDIASMVTFYRICEKYIERKLNNPARTM